jgi:2-polyprenyl-3-methyl-5-hydroxy-6-metoxy-1,4-benzoquinol methylase
MCYGSLRMQAPARDSVDYERRRAELPYGMHNREEIVNYFAWQVELFEDHARGTIIDHGAGTGGLSSALVAARSGNVIALEPDPQLVDVLREKFSQEARASVFAGTLDDYLAAHGPECVDTIVSSNVIEHIADDVACLQAMHELLRPGGAVGLYVPARPELFGSLDRAVGHYRRYKRAELTNKLGRAGFDVVSVKYRNLVGVLPWIVTGQILKRDKVGSGSLRLFDKVVFPVCRRLEDLFPPRYGLNLVAIATKR